MTPYVASGCNRIIFAQELIKSLGVDRSIHDTCWQTSAGALLTANQRSRKRVQQLEQT